MTRDIAQSKVALRRSMRMLRRERAPAQRARAGADAAVHLGRLLRLADGGPVAAFAALPEEIDTAAVIETILRVGRSVLLPRQIGRGEPLEFRVYRPGDPLLPGPFGVLEPTPIAPALRPRFVLLPLLAFDACGRRLGYGAGFYDRTLEALRRDGPPVAAIGLAFAFQEVPEVPSGPTDERLDGVVTEAGVREFEPPGPMVPRRMVRNGSAQEEGGGRAHPLRR